VVTQPWAGSNRSPWRVGTLINLPGLLNRSNRRYTEQGRSGARINVQGQTGGTSSRVTVVGATAAGHGVWRSPTLQQVAGSYSGLPTPMHIPPKSCSRRTSLREFNTRRWR